MSVAGEGCSTAELKSVAVAVTGAGGGGRGSRRAVRWAVENLKPQADRFILVHVIPAITSIPTPSGDRIPIEELDGNVVAMYVHDMKVKSEEIFVPFKRHCKPSKIETLVLDGDNPATALLRYISESGIGRLVLGSCPSNCILSDTFCNHCNLLAVTCQSAPTIQLHNMERLARHLNTLKPRDLSWKLKGPGVPSTVLRYAPETCDVYVVSRHRIITKSTNLSSISRTSSKHWIFSRRVRREGSRGTNKQISGFYSSSVESKVQETIGTSSTLQLSYPDSLAYTYNGSSANTSLGLGRDHQTLGDFNLETLSVKRCNSMASTKTEQSDVQAEVEQLRLELQNTVSMYKRACEELVHAENKVQLLSSECLDEARRVNASLEREETFRKIASEAKAKHLEAVKEVEMARDLLSKEAYERQLAELNALKQSFEKQKITNALLSSDGRYRRYTKEEIEVATDFFSEAKVIGEGGYGKVYKCTLDHTLVAVKVLHPDASNKREEFLREVEVLSRLHHPHMVLLLGACPESGCLVYEYMENGSLDEHMFCQNGKPPLPWFIRFRIAFEIACGLAFLHSSKPEPIVHRDLKPGNILLDRNCVSKIGDVGLAKLISDVVPDDITEYRDSILAGTLFYMDPEYLRTGTVRPKSDLYAFGVITLQLLTASSRPNGLLLTVENAITNGSFVDILDKSITDWPLAETEELASMALKCSKLRCRERPDLETEVLPVLKRLADIADASVKLERNNIHAPSHYFCPILQEVMDDPHIAADGFTYEGRAIQAWLEKHNVSPVTKLKVQHTLLTPNHTLRSAIQDWRSRVTFSSS